jgi:hypothetical protein
MDNAGSTSADVESWTPVNYLEEGGFPALLWDTLKDFGYTTYPEYSTREVMTTGQLLRCEVKVQISACPTNPAWYEWGSVRHTEETCRTQCRRLLSKHLQLSVESTLPRLPTLQLKSFRYPSDTLHRVENEKLFFQPRATLTIALILSPQSAFQKPCTTTICEWWEKAYSIDTKSIDTKLRK